MTNIGNANGRTVGHVLVRESVPWRPPLRVACSGEPAAKKLATGDFEDCAKRFGVSIDASGSPSVSDGNGWVLKFFHWPANREFAVGFLTGKETAEDGSETYYWNECRTYSYPERKR